VFTVRQRKGKCSLAYAGSVEIEILRYAWKNGFAQDDNRQLDYPGLDGNSGFGIDVGKAPEARVLDCNSARENAVVVS
jgi:hypothetical protein